MRISRLNLPRRSVGEGPVWDLAEQALYYIDILEQKVLCWHPGSDERREWAVPAMIGSMALREGGGAIVALVDGIHTLDFTTGEVSPDPRDHAQLRVRHTLDGVGLVLGREVEVLLGRHHERLRLYGAQSPVVVAVHAGGQAYVTVLPGP